MFLIEMAGCDSWHQPGEAVHHLDKREFYIFLYVKTPSIFSLNGAIFQVKPESFLLISPEVKAIYSSEEVGYRDDWINFFDTDHHMQVMKTPCNQPFVLDGSLPIEPYMKLINQAYHSGLPNRQEIMSHLLQALLVLVENYCNPQTTAVPHYRMLLSLRQQIYAEPQRVWTVELLAKSAGLSAVYFQELYKKAFHISCGNDLIQSRINSAKRYLRETAFTMEEIAERCGYQSVVHFSRQFKQKTGLAPSKWRQEQELYKL